MRALAHFTMTLCIGGLLFGCAAVERAVPSTLSDANLVSVLLTIDAHEIEVAQLAIEKASSDPARQAQLGRSLGAFSSRHNGNTAQKVRRGL